MNERPSEERPARILVAIDASPQSLAALHAALELASDLDAEVDTLFVEDINLIHLCGLPFGREIGSYTGMVRRLESNAIESQLRAQAGHIERSITTATAHSPIRWTFRVSRGAVVDELLAAADRAAILSLGRAGQMRRRSLGSTAQALVRQSRRPLLILGETGSFARPLTAVFTGSPASERALRWIAGITQHHPQPVRVLVLPAPDTPREEMAAAVESLQARARAILGETRIQFIPVRHGAVLATLHANNGGTLVLPGEYAALLADHVGPTVLVP